MKLRSRNILTLLQDKTCDYEDRIALGMKSSFGWKELTYKGIGLLSSVTYCFIFSSSLSCLLQSSLQFHRRRQDNLYVPIRAFYL